MNVPLPTPPRASADAASSYLAFDRRDWAKLRSATPLTLTAAELARLQGLNEKMSLADVTDIFLPLSRLLNLHVAAARNLGQVQDAFLGRPAARAPYVIGIAGSVAVGKSTFARVLRAVLAHWPDHPHVELVTTDGFLYPREVLEQRDLMRRKGFPESYDLRRMIGFLADLKAGAEEVAAPIYSHQTYDIVPGESQVVRRPDILIFEGLNVLQPTTGAALFASDFFDFSIYLDADEKVIEGWYVDRFLLLQRTAFQKPSSYFHHYKDLDEAGAREVAHGIWSAINLVNLQENIRPTRQRARLVMHKAADHAVDAVYLRKM